ncbi:MAG: hypothetical protein MUF84_00940 [Anaerolineae bacterium]|jgi:hypothetical protein|nr:hypothetical protein [Anaerolineae bacterium]
MSLLGLTEGVTAGVKGRWGAKSGFEVVGFGRGVGVGALDVILDERMRSDGAGRDGGLLEDLLPPADGAGFRFSVIFASTAA